MDWATFWAFFHKSSSGHPDGGANIGYLIHSNAQSGSIKKSFRDFLFKVWLLISPTHLTVSRRRQRKGEIEK
jgi:hypothetical protein